jgi:Phosphate transport (Pho88)
MLSLHFLVYLQLGGNKKRNVKIWVPPAAKPVLPFGMGPPAEDVKPEEYKESTYGDHEMKLLKESVTSVLMSTGISLLMSFKFNVHVSLIIQTVTGPLGAVDSLILKKYILGISKDNMYGEFFEAPTAEAIASVAAIAAGQEPKVVELKEEDEKKEKKSTGSKCAEVPSKSTVTDLD